MPCSKFGSLQLLAPYSKNNIFICEFVQMYVRIYFNSASVINLGTKGTTPLHVFLFYKKEKTCHVSWKITSSIAAQEEKKLYLNLTWFDLQDIQEKSTSYCLSTGFCIWNPLAGAQETLVSIITRVFLHKWEQLRAIDTALERPIGGVECHFSLCIFLEAPQNIACIYFSIVFPFLWTSKQTE